MGILASIPLEEIRGRGSIRDADVARLRCALDEGHTILPDEAEALLALGEACPVRDPSWAGFLTEAITDFLVHQSKPEGYLVAEQAGWLVARLGEEGRVRSATGLDLLLRAIGVARWSPPSLAAFALDQIRHAVVSGDGPLRTANAVEPGAIAPGDVDLARRILLGFGRESGLPITRAEAGALLDINRAIAPGRSSPAWSDLLVRTVGNGVLAGMGYVVPGREAMLRELAAGAALDAIGAGRVGERGREPGGQLIADGAGCIWSSSRRQSAEERAMARLERQRLEIVTGERIEAADEAWLADRLAELPLDANGQALLAFIKREANGLPRGLAELAARAVIAA